MKIMWCWRCKQDVGMLEEDEYAVIDKLYRECIKNAKKYREINGSSLENTPLNDLFKPVSVEYEKITGYKNFHHNATIHHRLLNYGPPCVKCGKPLRTPRAKMCAACGAKLQQG